jgi:hypothetical protein
MGNSMGNPGLEKNLGNEVIQCKLRKMYVQYTYVQCTPCRVQYVLDIVRCFGQCVGGRELFYYRNTIRWRSISTTMQLCSSVHCALCTVHYKLCTTYCVLCTMYYILRTIYFVLSTVLCTTGMYYVLCTTHYVLLLCTTPYVLCTVYDLWSTTSTSRPPKT